MTRRQLGGPALEPFFNRPDKLILQLRLQKISVISMRRVQTQDPTRRYRYEAFSETPEPSKEIQPVLTRVEGSRKVGEDGRVEEAAGRKSTEEIEGRRRKTVKLSGGKKRSRLNPEGATAQTRWVSR